MGLQLGNRPVQRNNLANNDSIGRTVLVQQVTQCESAGNECANTEPDKSILG